MDEGILQSRAERYVRNLDPIPDRWFFDGRHITAIYGTRVEEIPFPTESKGFAAEGDEVWRQPTDDRTSLEESFDVNTEYMLAVSICPDYLVGESIPKAMKEAMFLIQLIISEQIIEPSEISVQIDTENNEIDLVIATELVFADMSMIHEGITRVVSDNDINAYVYAAFMGSLDRDFYPLNFGYPSGRQAMVGRSFAAEDTLVRNKPLPTVVTIYGAETYEWEWDRTDYAPTELIKKRLKEAGFKLSIERKGYGNEIIEFYEPKLVAKNGNLLDVTLSQNEEFDGFSRLTFYDDNDENATGSAPPMDWDILYEKGLLKGEDGVKNPQGDYYQAYWDGLYDEWKNGHNCADNAKFDIYEDNFIVMECEVCGKTATFEQKTPYEGPRNAEDTLVRNAAIKIGDTDTIVERVAALQRAMNDSEMQERLIEVQYGTKHGLITSMEQALSILAGMGDSFSSEGVDDAIRTQWQSRAGQFIPREEVADEITSLVHEMIADDLLDMFNDREVSGQRIFSPPHCLQLIPDSELPTDADSASWGITSRESIPDDYSALASAWFRSNKYADPNSFITIYIDDQPAFLHSNPDALSIDSWDSYEESLHDMLSDRFDITIYDEDDDEMEACSQCLAKNRYDSSMCWSCTSFIGDETFDAETPRSRGRPVGSGGGTVTCGRCGNTGHNARTCSQTPKQSSVTPTSGAMDRKTNRRYACSVCNETGHNKSSCPTLTDTPVPVIKDYRDVDGFEMWPYGGETKMESVGRIKRNVRRILAAHPRGLGRSELRSIYQHNTGSFKKTRPGVSKSTRLASKMPDVIEWRDRFYLLGDGGKQEFFKTGPGSLRS